MFLDRISNTFKLKLLIICLISCVVSFLNPLKIYQSGMCNGYPITMLLMFFIGFISFNLLSKIALVMTSFLDHTLPSSPWNNKETT